MSDAPLSFSAYRLLRLLGRGGMGVVYEAYQESMRRRVALKVLEPQSADALEEVLRFEREAWIGGRLAHPNIVKVHDRGEEGGRHYLSMEYIEGGSLADRIARQRATPPPDVATRRAWCDEVAALFVGAASALQHVHDAGIVHRDIKPSNLLLDARASRLLLTDFGVARVMAATSLTSSGFLIGTVAYMSPEQLQARRASVDHRSDIWALGVSLYEALTLRLPFAASDGDSYTRAVGRRLPDPPRLIDPEIPEALEAIVLKCLEHEPARRYASAEELRADLSRHLRGELVRVRAPGRLGRAARWVGLNRPRFAVPAMVLVLIGGIGFVGQLRLESTRRHEAIAYHRYVAERFDASCGVSLADRVTSAGRLAQLDAARGVSEQGLLLDMRRAGSGFSSPELVSLNGLSGLSAVMIGHRLVVCRRDSVAHPGHCFVGVLLRGPRAVIDGAVGWWIDPQAYIEGQFDDILRTSSPRVEWDGTAASSKGVRDSLVVTLVRSDGKAVLQRPENVRERYPVKVQLTSPFDGLAVRVASATTN